MNRSRRNEAMGVASPPLLRRLIKWGVRLVVGGFLFSVFSVAVLTVLPIPATPLMLIRSVVALGEGKSPGWKKNWVALEEMSPKLMLAVVAAEDARFLEHNGFDFEAIDKAIRYNQKSTRRIRGGSTITQQVAKNVFLWPSRSWIRKGIEVYFTGLIELMWSKRRIMEVYLNIAEMGDGVYGVEAAARTYFKKPAKKLNSSEAALLAAVLPNPRRFLVQRPSGYVRFRQTMIQRRMSAVTAPRP
ncbi:MAG: monofunctional biosynthetic peptidoglycan transglycosylase [Bdellovibrionaceae bacterium]|nr:monofunctional biosynthetic peptidoglycan transglycosylase [Pseudobdellovibrionaceae bacterium]